MCGIVRPAANRYALRMSEILPLVDEAGNVVGRAPRSQCHGDPALIHPVIHLHVTDGPGRLLLQRRSSKKDLLPGFWDTAVGGHLSFGEKIEEALARETREELGIDASGARFLYHYLWKGLFETEFVRTFLLTHRGPFRIDPEEVAEVRFFDDREIYETIGKGVCTPNFEEEWRRLKLHGLF